MLRAALLVLSLTSLNFFANAQTTLLTAAGLDDLTAVRLALSQGAAIDAEDEYGQTALIYAVDGGASRAVIQTLLEAGADVNAAAEGGWTPLHHAARADSVPHIRQLLRAGAQVRVSTDDRQNVLTLATGSPAKSWLLFAYMRPFSTLAVGALIYLLLLQPVFARRFGRLLSRMPVLEQGDWHQVELWSSNQAASTRARVLTVQPLVAFVIGAFALSGAASLVSPVQLGPWEFLALIVLLIFVVFRHVRERFLQNRDYVRKPVPAHLRPLGTIIQDLSNGWHFQVDADGHARVGHEQVPDVLYRLVYSAAEGDLRKDERGRITHPLVAEQLSALGPNQTARPSLSNVLYAPNATASSVDDRIATGHGWVFCADGSSVTQQLEAWHVTHLGAKLASDRGREVEATALQQAEEQLPADWQLHPRYLMQTEGADIDLLIRLPNGQCYTVDIKSHRGDPRSPQSAKSWQETVDQVHRQAREVHGRPVVWQPEARRDKTVIEHGGVLFVAGDAAALRDVLLRQSGT